MPFTKQVNTEPIPGYRLLAPLGCGGFGEVWKCEAPGGFLKAIKFVHGDLQSVQGHCTEAHEEFEAIQRIKGIRHPFLLSIDRVENVRDELIIVTELADQTLHDVLKQCLDEGRPGMPRDSVLHYLAEAAEVLDLMNQQHALQHLDVKPRNLFLVSNHVKVADFGLVTSLATGGGVRSGCVTPLYAAPEVFQGKASHASDQYSLACCFVELVTGQPPFHGSNSRQLMMKHVKSKPDLKGLLESDRAAVAQALAKEAGKRHRSCADFVRMLTGLSTGWGQPWGGQPSAASPAALQATAAAGNNGNKPVDSGVNRSIHKPQAVPPALKGYQFQENLASTLLADVWKTVAGDGRPRLVKSIHGFSGQTEKTASKLRALQHPGLPPTEVVQCDPGSFVLVHDFAPQTVFERWKKCQSQHLPGIPRIELLGYLRTAAEVLDHVYEQHSIYHLSLNPRLLQLSDHGLQIADFGLAQLFWLPAERPVAKYNSRYAAPELFDGQMHRASDQYSLAIMYQELLTGSHPFKDGSRAGPPSSRSTLKINLAGVPEAERPVLARALEFDPQQRWPSCMAFIEALDAIAKEAKNTSEPAQRDDEAFQEIIAATPRKPRPKASSPSANALRRILKELISQSGGAAEAADQYGPPRLAESGEELEHRFRVGLPVGTARARVEGFRQECNGRVISEDSQSCVFHVPAPSNFWRQWIGRQPELAIHVQFTRLHPMAATPIDVAVAIRALRCASKKAAQLVPDFGAQLLEGLRACLLVNSEKRAQDRLLWPHTVEVSALEEDGAVGPVVKCRGKDISLTGIGFYLPHELPTSHVLIRLPDLADLRDLTMPATLVRANRCADGWYDVGALFHLAALRESTAEFCLSS